jgi:hypothetical protein
MKTIGYLGLIDKLFGARATTRNWNTIVAVARILKGEDKKAKRDRRGELPAAGIAQCFDRASKPEWLCDDGEGGRGGAQVKPARRLQFLRRHVLQGLKPRSASSVRGG